jgi:hypothetical protein
MKTIPKLVCVLGLLSASGLISGIDRLATPHLRLPPIPVGGSRPVQRAPSATRTPSTQTAWRGVTPAPVGPATTAGRAGNAVSFAF